MKKISFFILLFISIYAWSADPFEVYPTHWWAGMKSPSLSLLLRGEAIGNVKTIATGYPGITVKKIIAFENKITCRLISFFPHQ